MASAKKKGKREKSSLKTALLLLELLLIAVVIVLRSMQTIPTSETTQPGEDAGMTAALFGNSADSENLKQQNSGDGTSVAYSADSSDDSTLEEADISAGTGNAAGAASGNNNANNADARQGTDQPIASAGIVRRNDYTEETWHLASDMVYTYRYQQEEGSAAIAQLLDELKRADPSLGELWEKVMAFWSEVNREDYVCGSIPDDLPEDDSLCFVTLGFQLLPDGEMAPELLERCRTALECMRQYPAARLLLTGGGTAARGNPATEADKMAEWFESQGIPREKIIIENSSLTTTQNAKNSIRILAEQYPQIRTLAIVSSDYHIRLGSLLFQSAAYLREFEEGDPACVVAANASFPTAGSSVYESVSMQAQDLWSLMDPTYGFDS